MIVFLTLLGMVASTIVMLVVYRIMQSKRLVRGWSFEAEPSGTGYKVTILDSDGEQWGFTGYDYKVPTLIEKSTRSYRPASLHYTWTVSNPRFAGRYVVKCARKKATEARLDARQKVSKTL